MTETTLKTWVPSFGETIKAIRRLNPETTLETLIPDFQGNHININRIVEASPEVVSHNLETVRRLTRGKNPSQI